MATNRKKIRKMAIAFIQNETPLPPNNEANVQEDLSSTTPTHVPMIIDLEFKIYNAEFKIIFNSELWILNCLAYFLFDYF